MENAVGVLESAQTPQAETVSNGKFYHYEFKLDGRRHRGSTGTADRDEAVREESRQRERLEKSYSQVIEEEARKKPSSSGPMNSSRITEPNTSRRRSQSMA